MRPLLRILTALLLTTLAPACAPTDRADDGLTADEERAVACSGMMRVADLPAALDEVSGIAASRQHAGVLWVHNDIEDMPLLHAIDHGARRLAEIAVPGAGAQFDWEDLAIGPCPDGDCIYIGDIGDNIHNRDDRAILRLAEPRPDSRTRPARVERFPFRYPHGPEDAEALFVTPDTSIFIITKGRRTPVTLFRFPRPLRADERVTLEPVQQLSDGIEQLADLVTGADISADGRIVAVRTYSSLQLYRFAADTLVPLLAGRGFDLTTLEEPQGEGVALAGGDTIMLVTEAGPLGGSPFLSRLRCSVP